MSALQVVVMGVSGCGKTTLGRGLAERLGLPFVDGDDLHPPANVARMSAGIALTDDDRRDWLQAVGERLAEAGRAGTGLVITCSALKRRYRDGLRSVAPALRLVHLHGEAALLQRRLAARSGHYMPASLLDSQLQTLEWPDLDERAIALDIVRSPGQLVDAAEAALTAPSRR